MYNKLHVLLSNLLHVSARIAPSSKRTFCMRLKLYWHLWLHELGVLPEDGSVSAQTYKRLLIMNTCIPLYMCISLVCSRYNYYTKNARNGQLHVSCRQFHVYETHAESTDKCVASLNTEIDVTQELTCRQSMTYLLDVGTRCWQITNRC
jgi:hypothetical protein